MGIQLTGVVYVAMGGILVLQWVHHLWLKFQLSGTFIIWRHVSLMVRSSCLNEVKSQFSHNFPKVFPCFPTVFPRFSHDFQGALALHSEAKAVAERAVQSSADARRIGLQAMDGLPRLWGFLVVEIWCNAISSGWFFLEHELYFSIENNHPNWHKFFRGVQTTNQLWDWFLIDMSNML